MSSEMTRVMATGVFDIIHTGHLHFLKEAKKLGDELYVVVARDSTATRMGKEPVMDENSRFAIVSELRVVDRAILGREGDIYQTVKEVQPDIIVLGHDQKFDPDDIIKGCARVGVTVRVERLSKYPFDSEASSSTIRRRILEAIGDTL